MTKPTDRDLLVKLAALSNNLIHLLETQGQEVALDYADVVGEFMEHGISLTKAELSQILAARDSLVKA